LENWVKSIKTSLSRKKTLSTFSRNPHWLCWYKASRRRVTKNKPSVYTTEYQKIPRPFVLLWMQYTDPPAECKIQGWAECNTLLHPACTREIVGSREESPTSQWRIIDSVKLFVTIFMLNTFHPKLTDINLQRYIQYILVQPGKRIKNNYIKYWLCTVATSN
jgi:hypothetical protein